MVVFSRKVSWLGEGSSSVQQQALRDFDQALRNWWGGTRCRPTWRRKFQHEGFVIRRVMNMVRSAAGTVGRPGTNVAQKRGLNRSIYEGAWSMLAMRIDQKAAVSGG